MARWEIFRERSGNVRVQYVALWPARRVFECGIVRADTPAELLIKFIVEKGGAQPRDLIHFVDAGVVLSVLPPSQGSV